MKYRSYEPELIDLGPTYYTKEEYYHCLKQMGRIGSILGHDRATIKIFKQLKEPINSILDVGCGGGFFTIKLATAFKNAKVVGIDLDSNAINYANLNSSKIDNLDNLSFKLALKPELEHESKSVDVVTATLVCHHMTDESLINFLIDANRVARKAIIINDLHRSWLAYYAAKIIMPLMFRNRLVAYDSLLSIKKSFLYDDWVYFLNKASIKPENYKITWQWPYRWIVTVRIDE